MRRLDSSVVGCLGYAGLAALAAVVAAVVFVVAFDFGGVGVSPLTMVSPPPSSAPAGARVVPRDLLPFPIPGVLDDLPGPRSRSVRQRWARQARVQEQFAEMVWTVNELYGAGHIFDGARLSEAQYISLVRMETAALLDKPPSDLPTAEACLTHVLGSKA